MCHVHHASFLMWHGQGQFLRCPLCLPSSMNSVYYNSISFAVSTSASTGDIQIQPLVNHPVVHSGSGGPPMGESSSSSNPYRIGTGVGTRKPAFGTSGIASFGSSSSSSTSSALGGGQQIMVPYPLPPPQEQVQPLKVNVCYYSSRVPRHSVRATRCGTGKDQRSNNAS